MGEEPQDTHNTPLGQRLATAEAAGEQVEELRDRVRYLERQVEEEREARRRADMLLAELVQRIRKLEPPGQDAPQEHTEATEQPGRVERQATIEAAQEEVPNNGIGER